MGEAKRREAKDPTWGKAKVSEHRGLVVSPPITVDGTKLSIHSTSLHPQELRFALLFWDRLVWPSSRTIFIEGGVDEAFLQQEGVLTRPDYTRNGSLEEIVVKAHLQAFLDLDRKEPGLWAMAQGETSLLWREGVAAKDEGAALTLYRAIPIPSQDVPLAEILEFKRRRRSELLALRANIESFVSEIEGAEDKSTALEHRLKQIDTACADLLSVSKEWQFPVYLTNLKASFSLSPLKFLPAVAAGWKLGEPYGLTAAASAAAIGGAVSTLDIKADYGLRPAKRPSSPYRYAYSIEKELR